MLPHAATTIDNAQLQWDKNGNLIRQSSDNGYRNLCWDEENRLTAVNSSESENYLSLYLYNANNERVWKFAGSPATSIINGQEMKQQSVMLNKTLYVNPYMVVTENDYTKHYFIESRRVTTKIGSGFGTAPFLPCDSVLEFISGDESSLASSLNSWMANNLECAHYTDEYEIVSSLDPVCTSNNTNEGNQYFYHSDHLGSASFITYTNGRPVQHLLYMPFGELFTSQLLSSFDSRYKFSAKELDSETNYSYFGARYYDSDLSNWLSVDPMADERSWVSPYSYCQNNPVVKVDPNGSLDTDFGVKANGEVVQIGKTNNNPDRLFAINDDGTKKDIAPITVNDKNLLPALASVDPSFKERQYPDINAKRIGVYNPKTKSWTWTEKKTMIQGYYGTTFSKKDAKSVFTYTATNTDVEWGMKGNKNSNWIVGTLRQNAQAPKFSRIAGFNFENIIYQAHSHSGNSIEIDFQPSENDLSGAKSLRKINSSAQSWLFMPKNPSIKWKKL